MWGANAPRPWVQYTKAVIAPQGEARNEYDIYAAILQRLGLPSPLAMLGNAACPDPDPIAVADALLRAGPWGDRLGAAGLSVARLESAHPHGMRYLDRVDAGATLNLIHYDDGKVRLWGDLQAGEFARLSQVAAKPAGEGGRDLRLFGRRRLQSLNSWMHNSERLTRGHQPTLQVHPEDAIRLGIADGQAVRVVSSANALVLTAELTDEVVAGSVCYPHGWGHRGGGWQRANSIGGGNVNLLASDDPADWEQVSGMCLLDGIPVRLEPVIAD